MLEIKAEKKKLVPAGAFGASIFLHLAILFLLGGIVLIEKVIPKSPMTGDMPFDQSVPSAPDPEPEEAQAEPLSSEPAADTSSSPKSDEDAMSNLISTEVAAPTQTIVMSAPTTALSVGNSLNVGTPGVGTGTGKLAAAKGKTSSINFFGIKGDAKRVAFLLDASGSMVTVQHGGKEGYARLKADLDKMVQKLDPETSFCVFIFDSTVDQFRPTDVQATPENKKAFSEWLSPYMSQQFGNLLKNYQTENLQGFGGTTRMDLALTAAFESGCDSIFILTDGTPSVFRPPTEKEENEWQRVHDKNAKEIEAFKKIDQEYMEKYKDLIAEMQQEVKRRNAALDGRQKEIEYWIEGYKGLPPRPTSKAPPGMWKPRPKVTEEELIDYLKKLYADIYAPISQAKPQIHIVGYGVIKEDSEFLKHMSKQFNGTYTDFKFEK